MQIKVAWVELYLSRVPQPQPQPQPPAYYSVTGKLLRTTRRIVSIVLLE